MDQSRKVYTISTLHYNWPMSVHASELFFLEVACATISVDLRLFYTHMWTTRPPRSNTGDELVQ